MHRASSDFWQAYNALPETIQRRADKQFELLEANPQHPSLQFKKLGERHYEQEVDSNIRAGEGELQRAVPP